MDSHSASSASKHPPTALHAAPPATVLWWDNEICCVRCPYCQRRHEHQPVWKDGRPLPEYRDACRFKLHRRSVGQMFYRPLYPFQRGHITSLAWEVDKRMGRFITVGAIKSEEDWDTDYSEDEKGTEEPDSDGESEKKSIAKAGTPRPRTGSILFQKARNASIPSVASNASSPNRIAPPDCDGPHLEPDMESLLQRLGTLGIVEDPKTDESGDYFSGEAAICAGALSPPDMRKRIVAEQARRNFPSTPLPADRYASPASTPARGLPTPPTSPEPAGPIPLSDFVGRMEALERRMERYSQSQSGGADSTFSEDSKVQPSVPREMDRSSAFSSVMRHSPVPVARSTPSTPSRTRTPTVPASSQMERKRSRTVDPDSLDLSGLTIDDENDDEPATTWITYFDEAMDKLLQEGRKRVRSRYFSLIRLGDAEGLALLIKCSPDDVVAFRDRKGNNGLILAARYGLTDIINALYAAKKSLRHVNIRNKAGRTALMEAVLWGHLETVELLLSIGADANMLDAKGRAALQFLSPSLRNDRERQQRNASMQHSYNSLSYLVTNGIRAHLRMHIIPSDGTPAKSSINEFSSLPNVYARNESTSETYFETTGLGFTSKHVTSTTRTETTHYRLPEQFKGVARLHRGVPFADVAALSGWNQSDYSAEDVIDNSEWTIKAQTLCHRYLGYGGPGSDPMTKRYASHVEPQLLAYYIEKHVLLDSEWENLKAVMPPDSVKAEVLVNKSDPCTSCDEFLRRVVDRLGLRMTWSAGQGEGRDNLKVSIG